MLAGTIFQIVIPIALCRHTHSWDTTLHGLLRTKHDESLGRQWVIMGYSHSTIGMKEVPGKSGFWCPVILLWVWFWMLVHRVLVWCRVPLLRVFSEFRILVGVSWSLLSLGLDLWIWLLQLRVFLWLWVSLLKGLV